MACAGLFYRAFYKTIKGKIWKTLGVKLSKERSIFLAHLLNELKRELKIPNSVSASECYLLDIGCGNGDLTGKISEIYNLKTIGIDLDKKFSFDGGVIFLVANGCSLPFRSNSSVLVVAFSLIEHIHEVSRREFCAEVSKVLIDDGIFIMQLPNRYFPIEQHTFIPFLGYFPSKFNNLFYHDFVSVPSINTAICSLEKGGFKTVKILRYGVPFSGFLRKIVPSRIFPFGFLIVAKKMV